MRTAPLSTADPLVRGGETREVLWHFPGWLEVTWYLLAVLSVLVFAYGVLRPIARYRRGAGGLPPREDLPARLRHATAIVASHASVARRDRYAGVAHAAIVYGFAVLFLGTVVLAINTDVTERFFGWRFFTGHFYRWYSVVLDVMGIGLLAGVLAMMFRRAVIRPRKLDYARPDRAPDEPQQDRRGYRWGDWLLVGGLLYLLLTGYALEGTRIAMDRPAGGGYSPVGWAAAQTMTGMGSGALEVMRMTLWWSHGVVAISFVAAIPFTKAMHMLTSFASLVLADPLAGKRLAVIPAERADAPAGYGVLDDFSVPHLVQLDACTKCGRCHEACPANATGLPLSPRDVILELHERPRRGSGTSGLGGVLGGLLASAPADTPVVGPDRVRPETVWSCMQCNACVEACPVGIEQAPIINQLRRRMVEDGEAPSEVQTTLRAIRKSGNSLGASRRRRGHWTQELDFEVPDARETAVDVLWFVGDYASFDPRSQEVSRALARLYRAAGVNFGILYDGEGNAGNDVRRVGEEGLWEMLAEQNISTLREASFGRIVTSDPHSLNTLRNEYPALGGSWRVDHHTTFLLELIEAGRLDIRGRLDYRVTYHDPCYLGRHNGEYDAPRRILELLGCTLVEMPRNREQSFCCGAGGGRIWMREDPAAERPSENRIREATALGELDLFVVSCPKDVTMYEDAIKTTGHADQLGLQELTELVAEALRHAEAERRG
ncbi:MAG: glpC [Conexibacter sp.]|nr:glpC [Conexibacter sp.]